MAFLGKSLEERDEKVVFNFYKSRLQLNFYFILFFIFFAPELQPGIDLIDIGV